MLDNISKYNILLASKSPRRHELMKMLDVPFGIASPVEVEEVYPESLPIDKVPEYLSRLKAEAYKPLICSNEMIITADTVVINEGEILGKPCDENEARQMLHKMSGHTHTVISGVCITTAQKQISFDVRTEVVFALLTSDEIDFYVNKYKPLDKAGAYGIQEWIGAAAVAGIKGSFYNVMGLPVHQLYQHLRKF